MPIATNACWVWQFCVEPNNLRREMHFHWEPCMSNQAFLCCQNVILGGGQHATVAGMVSSSQACRSIPQIHASPLFSFCHIYTHTRVSITLCYTLITDLCEYPLGLDSGKSYILNWFMAMWWVNLFLFWGRLFWCLSIYLSPCDLYEDQVPGFLIYEWVAVTSFAFISAALFCWLECLCLSICCRYVCVCVKIFDEIRKRKIKDLPRTCKSLLRELENY